MKSKDQARAIIVDLDGTLANNRERRKLLDEDSDWESFNARVLEDQLNEWCKELILSFKDNFRILLVTGRREICKEDTLLWLKNHEIPYDFIFFRGKSDFRPDSVVKLEIFEKHIRQSFDILFVVDDRNSVVKMWRGLGLTCLQCDVGDF